MSGKRLKPKAAAETETAAAGDSWACEVYVPKSRAQEMVDAAVQGVLRAVQGMGAKPTKQSPRKTKRSTERGEARAKLIAALTKHHAYADGGCLNFEPVGCNELARLARVSPATASVFFQNQFGGHVSYRRACGNETELLAALMLLNDELPPRYLLNREPADPHTDKDDSPTPPYADEDENG